MVYNKWTLRYDFAYVAKAFDSSFEQQWTETTFFVGTASNTTEASAAGAAPTLAVKGGDPQTPEPAPNPRRKGGKEKPVVTEAERLQLEKERAEEKETKKAEKKEMDGMLKTLKAAKDRWCAATASYSTLAQRIQTDDAWRWARGEEQRELEQNHNAMEGVRSKSKFWADWALRDTNSLRDEFGLKAMREEMRQMEAVSDVISRLEGQAKTLLAMQRTRLRPGA